MDKKKKTNITVKHPVRTKILNQDVAALVFFLFLSFILWYLNSLKKEMESSVNYPVKYINLPDEMVKQGSFSSEITINLEGTGFSLLKLKSSFRKSPIIIDISSAGLNKISSSEYFLITESLVPVISKQLNRDGVKILSVKPDTVYLPFGKK